jgi:hypothetical protein
MRIAVLFSGQPRFTGDFDKFLENLTGYDYADWFCYITNNNSTHDVSSDVSILDSWKSFDAGWAIEKIQSNLPNNNYIASFAISDCEQIDLPRPPPSRMQTFYKMWYNVYRSNQLRLDFEKQHNVKYDLVIRARSDVGIIETLDLKAIDLKHIQQNIIMPENQWAGLACDQFGMGSPENMNVYCDLVNHAENYPYAHDLHWHPESSLGHHLNLNNISSIKEKFNITLRQYPIDQTKWS